MKKNTIIALLFVVAFGGSSAFSQTWKEMTDSTREYYGRANYDAALRCANTAVQIAEKEFGKADSNYATSLNNLGGIYYALSNYAEAEPLYKEALRIWKEKLGDRHPLYSTGLNNLGLLYEDLGRYAEAEPFYKEAIRIKKDMLGADHPSYAVSLNNLAGLYKAMGRYEEAEPLFKQAMEIRKKSLGDKSPDYASSLNNLGSLYRSMGRYPEAEPLYKEAADIRKEKLGGKHPDYAASLNNLAILYWNMGRYPEAESLYKAATKIDGMALGKNTLDYATDLNNLAELYKETGRYPQAESLSLEALRIRTERLGPNHPDVTVGISNLAGLYTDMGRYAVAESLYKETLRIRKEQLGEGHPDYARSLNNLAQLYWTMGRYLEAEPLYKEAMRIWKETVGEEHPDYATSLFNLGALYKEMGRYDEVEPLYKEVLRIRKDLLGVDHPLYADALNNLAVLYEAMGRLADAEPLYKEALRIRMDKLGDRHPLTATGLNNLGHLFATMGRTAEAIPFYQEALRIQKEVLGDNHPDYANSLNNLAALYAEIGEYAGAESLYKESMRIRKEQLGEDHPEYAASLNNLGALYQDMKQYTDAEPLYREALRVRKAKLGETHPDYANSLNNLAVLYQNMGRYADAEPLFREALKVRKEHLGVNHPDYAASVNNLAILYFDMGRYKDAEPLFTGGLAATLRTLTALFPSLSEGEKGQYYNTLTFNFEIFNSFVLARAAENPAIIESLYALRLPTKGLLQQATARIRDNILRSNDSVLQQTYATWKSGKDYLARLYTMSKADVEKQNVNIEALEVMVNNLEKELGKVSGMFAGPIGDTPVTPANIRSALSNDEAAVELIRFNLYDKRWTDTVCYAALILQGNRKEHPELVTLMNGNELEGRCLKSYPAAVSVQGKDLAALDRGVAKEEVEADSLPAPEDLYAQYWKNIQAKLAGIKTVYLSVDGVYNQINLGTLYNPETKKYLFEELDIRLVTNTRQLAINGKRETSGAAGKTAELFGFPDYELGSDRQELLAANYRTAGETRNGNFIGGATDSLKSMSFNPLPGTKVEVENIASLLKKSGWTAGVHLADNALEEAVKAVRNPRVLMLSTHGFFLEDVNLDHESGKMLMGMQGERVAEDPLFRSGLIFAGANRTLRQGNGSQPDAQIDNGILTAYEAMNLNLDSTELVVLSACETGRGEIRNGEGVYGLQRAFEAAGAKAILMSLWSVSDEATQQLMSAFYKNWLGGMDKHEALKVAQQQVREKFPQPYFWGAFVLVGE